MKSMLEDMMPYIASLIGSIIGFFFCLFFYDLDDLEELFIFTVGGLLIFGIITAIISWFIIVDIVICILVVGIFVKKKFFEKPYIYTKKSEEAEIVDAIESYEPLKKYKTEETYHMELTRFLRDRFHNVNIEESRGSSRPDIVIGDIAIEVKGPTYDADLITIADKCLRYSQHYQHLIIVLFDVNVNQDRYNEWLRGMENKFPDVHIIRK